MGKLQPNIFSMFIDYIIIYSKPEFKNIDKYRDRSIKPISIKDII